MTATAKLHRADVILQVTLMLGEAEVRALNQLGKYGAQAFLDAIAKHISPTLAKEHEIGLRGIMAVPLEHLVECADAARAEFRDPRTPRSARR